MYYLYKKTHLTTNLQYLGYTTKDPFKYLGSGIYWKKHIKKHGKNIKTEILLATELYEDVKSQGKYYSDLWDIVDSDQWANLKPEHGDGGTWVGLFGENNPTYMKPRPQHVKTAASNANKGRKNPFLTQLNKSRTGIKRTEETKSKISKSKWYTNNIIEIRSSVPIDGFIRGRLKKKVT